MSTNSAEEFKNRIENDLQSNQRTRINVFSLLLKDLVDLLFSGPGVSTQDYENLRNQVFGTLEDPQLEEKIGETNLLDFLLNGIKAEIIDLPQDVNIDYYVSDFGNIPSQDRSFTTTNDSLTFIKQKVQNNDADVYDGYEMYVFKKGAGIWGLKAEGSTNTNIQNCYLEDFILINKELFITEEIPTILLGEDYINGGYVDTLLGKNWQHILDGLLKTSNSLDEHKNDPEAHVELIDKAKVYDYGTFQIFKSNTNTSGNLEVGDVAVGFLTSGAFIPFGRYLGGDIQDINNWDTSPMFI